MVFGFPFGRFRCGRKRFRRESAMGLPSLPLTWWAEEIGGSTDLSDYQIAHMPPLAACAGAARWAAKYKECALLRSVFCRTACQHAADKPAHRRAEHGSGSGSYRRVPEPVIARHPRGAWERQRGEERRRFLMGLFASYHVRRKGIPKTMGLWRRFCILLPPRANGCRAGARNIPARGMKGTSNGPSGTPAPTQ